jgi:hypothetical protein
VVAVQHHIGAERIREYDDQRDAELGERSQLLRLLSDAGAKAAIDEARVDERRMAARFFQSLAQPCRLKLTHLADCSGLSPPDEKIWLCTGVLGKPERLLIVGLKSPAVSVSIKVSGEARLG